MICLWAACVVVEGMGRRWDVYSFAGGVYRFDERHGRVEVGSSVFFLLYITTVANFSVHHNCLRRV